MLEATQVTITIAGALRTSTNFVEELPLIGQPPQDVTQIQSIKIVPDVKRRTFRGTLRLSAFESKALGRTVLVLDAVIRKKDHSAATFKAWRGQDRSQPLKYLLKRSSEAHPFTHSFLFQPTKSGITLDIEAVLPELANIWSATETTQISPEHVRSLVESYYPIAFDIKNHELMPRIFHAARNRLKEMG